MKADLLLISSRNILTDTSRNNVLLAIWASFIPIKLTHKINHHTFHLSFALFLDRHAGSLVVAHRLSCPTACEVQEADLWGSVSRASLALWFLVGLGQWEPLTRDGKAEVGMFILPAPPLLD